MSDDLPSLEEAQLEGVHGGSAPFRAQSDLNAAGMHTNPFFRESDLAGEMPGGAL